MVDIKVERSIVRKSDLIPILVAILIPVVVSLALPIHFVSTAAQNDTNYNFGNASSNGSTTTGNTFPTKYHFVSKIGFSGTGQGRILEPTDLSIDTSNNIMYVADKSNNRIQKLDLIGKYLASWGSLGSNRGEFNNPADLAIDYSTNILFIADIGNNRIQKFDTNGKFLGMWGSFGTGEGQFNRPAGIEYD